MDEDIREQVRKYDYRNDKRCHFKVQVTGKRALFTRPDLRTERYTYEVITPSAAVGILASVYSHPYVEWVTDRITVHNQIKMQSIVKNEVKAYASGKKMFDASRNLIPAPLLNASEERVMRRETYLRDVCYTIDCHFELIAEQIIPKEGVTVNDIIEKVRHITERRLESGGAFQSPYIGTKECFADVTLVNEHTARKDSFYSNVEVYDFGFILHHTDESTYPQRPYYYRAVMRRGVIDLTDCEVFG